MTATASIPPHVRPGLVSSSILALTALAGAAGVLYYVRAFGTNVPTGDDWDLLRTLLAWRTGGPTVASLFAFHNEHRIVATRAIDSVLFPLADGDFRIALLFNASFVVATLFVFLSFVRRESAHPLYLVFVYAAIVCLVVGWYQWQNLLWAFQLPWLLLPLLLVLTIWCLCFVRRDGLCLALVAVLFVAALLCQSNGVVVWLAAIPAVLARPNSWSHRSRIVATAALVALPIVAASVYFFDLPAYVVRPSARAVFEQPLRFAHFFLAVLGSPFSAPLALLGPVRWTGVIAGASGLVAAAVAWVSAWRHGPIERRSARFVLATGLIVFSSASVLAISVGRFTRFSPDEIESRYSTFALYFYVGLILLFFAKIARDLPVGRRTGSLRSAFLLTCLLAVGAATWGDTLLFRHGQNLKLAMSRVKASLNLSLVLPDRPELATQAHTVPPAERAALLDALEQHRLWQPPRLRSLWRNQLVSSPSIGNVDEAVDHGDHVTLRGWSRLPDGLPADAVVAMAPNAQDALVPVAMSDPYRAPRPDLAAVFGRDVVVESGWSLDVSRADYDRRPLLAAYSAASDTFYPIPFDQKPVSK